MKTSRFPVVKIHGFPLDLPEDGIPSLGDSTSHITSQMSLLRTRITARFPDRQVGKSGTFLGTDADGHFYYCKPDSDGRPSRANEWFSQNLARHLGISVPEFRVMETESGETFFGSREAISNAGHFEVRDYITRKKSNEVGGPSDWFGRWHVGLFVFDMFLFNPDRGVHNFVLDKDNFGGTLRAIDFADCRLDELASDRFPVATSNTVCNGKFIESVHGFPLDSAFEMIEKIRVIPVSEIDRIFSRMPIEWMVNEQRQQIRDAWADGGISLRLAALRAGLEDGSRR